MSLLVEIFPLKEYCAQIDELLDFFMRFFANCSEEMEEGQIVARFEVTDEYLLGELMDCFKRTCDTFPFLKSKTS
jgi:hypothetical protein